MFIIQSGSGFFVKFSCITAKGWGSPLMNTDPMCATRWNKKIALNIIKEFNKQGLDANIIPIQKENI
jgi:hypothetical protein